MAKNEPTLYQVFLDYPAIIDVKASTDRAGKIYITVVESSESVGGDGGCAAMFLTRAEVTELVHAMESALQEADTLTKVAMRGY